MSHYIQTLKCGCEVYGDKLGFYTVSTNQSGPACGDSYPTPEFPASHPCPKITEEYLEDQKEIQRGE
jgi:hypothetical protein